MGLHNASPIHQHHITVALPNYIDKFCYIYLDDIVIWSNLVEEHEKHVKMILTHLCKHCLYLNKRKCFLFQNEIKFLGYKIFSRGIETCFSKCEKILKWLCSKTTYEVWSFLGIVHYIAVYLKNLAEYTSMLTPFTAKEFNNSLSK
jgi:hypothetical protein